MKRRIEAWLWVTAGGIKMADHGPFDSAGAAWHHAPFMHLSNGHRLVRLTEHSPTAERVLKAALRYQRHGGNAELLALSGAAKAHLKATKRKL